MKREKYCKKDNFAVSDRDLIDLVHLYLSSGKMRRTDILCFLFFDQEIKLLL